MIENDADRLAVSLEELPKSAKLSLIKQNDKEGALEGEPLLQKNMLQVTVKDKTIIFDIE